MTAWARRRQSGAERAETTSIAWRAVGGSPPACSTAAATSNSRACSRERPARAVPTSEAQAIVALQPRAWKVAPSTRPSEHASASSSQSPQARFPSARAGPPAPPGRPRGDVENAAVEPAVARPFRDRNEPQTGSQVLVIQGVADCSRGPGALSSGTDLPQCDFQVFFAAPTTARTGKPARGWDAKPRVHAPRGVGTAGPPKAT